ncbi:LysE family translocator [Clostridium paraputrificum]|uniref:LysE family translocator n=1 Tax=Clostridium paraputrificum TaxID=29363 RepID=UPI003D3588B3
MIKLRHLVIGLLIGYFTGFGVSIPLGPSGIESVNRSITFGFMEGFKVSIGAILADITCILIINFGLLSFFAIDTSFEGAFWILSGIILIIFNYISKRYPTNSTSIFNNRKLGGLFSGYLITLLNPMTLSLWLAVSGTVMSVWRSKGNLYFICSFLAMVVGSLSWFVLLNFLATKGFRLFNKNIAKKTSSILDYVLLFLGIVFVVYGTIKLFC